VLREQATVLCLRCSGASNFIAGLAGAIVVLKRSADRKWSVVSGQWSDLDGGYVNNLFFVCVVAE